MHRDLSVQTNIELKPMREIATTYREAQQTLLESRGKVLEIHFQ